MSHADIILRELKALQPRYKTQTEFAHALGVSQQTLSAAFRGRELRPVAAGLARLRGVQVDDVLSPVPSWLDAALEDGFDSTRGHLFRDATAVRRVVGGPGVPREVVGFREDAGRLWLDAAVRLRHAKQEVTLVALLVTCAGMEMV